MTTTAADLQLMRATALLDTEPAAAARCASEILADAPANSAAQLLLATACRRLGEPERAIEVLAPLAAASPAAAPVQVELGRAYAAASRGAEAIAAFEAALAADPALLDAWRELAAQRFAQGDFAGGDHAYANYERHAPDPPGLHEVLTALEEERLESAEALLRQRLQRAPADPVALRLLADVASRREDYEEAERLLTDSLKLAPGYARARFDLANVHFNQHRPHDTLLLLERLLAVEPRHSLCLDLKARSLRLVGRFDEAIALAQAAVRDRPADDAAWVLLGHVLREVGRSEEAIDAYRRAIAVRGDSSEAFFSLANLKTVRFAEGEITAMRQLLARTTLRREDRVRLEFALGKALEDVADYAESFAAYARANRLHRSALRYDPTAAGALVQRAKSVYTATFFNERRGWGSDRSDPIFIVGIPRSGSTLIEQMLATHPQVEGTRELSELSRTCIELMSPLEPRARRRYPEPVATLERSAFDAAAAVYLERTAPHRLTTRPRFIDKMPANFNHVGLIQLLFPNAAIIDARRHPMGTGFSCYRQLFAFGASFSYDQAELGRYIRDYCELMDDFDRALPGRVHRVHYERLVAEPEAELRALLEYCRLPFDPKCLDFHENRRVVQSISSEQVRRPIYTEALDQWRHYAEWLAPLEQSLGDLIGRYPATLAAAG